MSSVCWAVCVCVCVCEELTHTVVSEQLIHVRANMDVLCGCVKV